MPKCKRSLTHICFVGSKTILRWKTQTARERERELHHLPDNSQTQASHIFCSFPFHSIYIWKWAHFERVACTQHSFIQMDVNVFHLGKVVLINFLHTHILSYSYSYSGIQAQRIDTHGSKAYTCLRCFSSPKTSSQIFSHCFYFSSSSLFWVVFWYAWFWQKIVRNQKRTQYIRYNKRTHHSTVHRI